MSSHYLTWTVWTSRLSLSFPFFLIPSHDPPSLLAPSLDHLFRHSLPPASSGGLERGKQPVPGLRLPLPLRRRLSRSTQGYRGCRGRVGHAVRRDEVAARGYHRTDSRHRSGESEVWCFIIMAWQLSILACALLGQIWAKSLSFFWIVILLIVWFLFYFTSALLLSALLLFVRTIPHTSSLSPHFLTPLPLIISIHLSLFSFSRGSGLIAGETSRAYDETFTLSYVTGRSVGIGAYLNRYVFLFVLIPYLDVIYFPFQLMFDSQGVVLRIVRTDSLALTTYTIFMLFLSPSNSLI